MLSVGFDFSWRRVLLFGLIIIGCLGLFTGNINALDETFPDLDDTEAGANVYAMSGETQYVRETNGDIRVWFPSNSGTVVIHNGHFCNSNSWDTMETSDGSWASYANGSNVTRFDPSVGSTQYGKKYASGNANCNDSIVFTFSGLTAKEPGTNWYYVNFSIDYVANANPGYDGGVNFFRVSASTGAKIGLPGGGSGYTTTQEQVDTTPAYTNYRSDFGAPCTMTAATATAAITLYDLDNQGGGGAQPTSGPKIRVQVEDLTTGNLVNFHGTTGTTWTPPDTQNNAQSKNFTITKEHKYRLKIFDVYYNNTIQYSLPHSQIYVLACPPPEATPAPRFTPGVGLGGGTATEIEAGDTATPSASITNSGTTGRVTWTWQFWYENGVTADAYDSGTDNYIGTGTYTGTHTGATVNSLSGGPGSAVVDGTKSRICTRLTLSNPQLGATLSTPAFRVVCKNIVRSPYLQAQHGDVNTTCAPTTTPGDITGLWNSTLPNGSSTNLAVYAGGSVAGFGSAFGRSANPVTPKGLTFANNGAGAFGDPFTGQKVGDCAVLGVIPASATASTSWADILAKVALSGSGTYYVNGHLTINSNFTATPGNTLNTLPYFKVVVKGDIYIAPNVSSLDGVYQATGTIYTCAPGGTKPTVVTSLPASCNNTLTINGALEANSIRFLRFFGSISSPGAPAERIIFSPLSWLGAIKSTKDPTQPDAKFDSYTIMPPVL